MAQPKEATAAPTRTRLIVSALIVVLVVLVVWKVIDYRQTAAPAAQQGGRTSPIK